MKRAVLLILLVTACGTASANQGQPARGASRSVLSDAASHSIVPSDPVSVTGYHIGDAVRRDTPAPWLSATKGFVGDAVPAWISVGDSAGNVVVGFQRRDSVLDPSLPPLIYDDTGATAIGCISSVAVIGTDAVHTCHAQD